MDCYRDLEDVENAFLEFMDRVPFYGATTACVDNAQLAAILPRVKRRVFTYGTLPHADYVARLLPPPADARSCFEVVASGVVLGPFELHVPGRHNVLNATAAVAIGLQLEIDREQIAAGLKSYRGVDRRFQFKGGFRGVSVVDDYGHHPTEIRATLAAARDCGFRRVHAIFQPHRYTRTRDLL
jgi:UDP-N-acetylmuramate--alanine ligase